MIKIGDLIVIKKFNNAFEDLYLNVPYRVIKVYEELECFTILDSNKDEVILYFYNDPDFEYEVLNNFITISNSEFNNLMKVKGFKILDLFVNATGCIFKVKVNNIIYKVNCLCDKEELK